MYIPTILGNPSSVLLSNEFNFQTAFRILFFIIINSCPRKCYFKHEVTKITVILLFCRCGGSEKSLCNFWWHTILGCSDRLKR